MQQRDPLLYGVIGVLIGGAIIWFLATNAVNNSMTGMMRMMGMRVGNNMMQQEAKEQEKDYGMGMGSSMDEMMDSLEGESGDEFDNAFMEAMIVHHQGAIEMAKEAKEKAKHQEIKDLAEDIISAQTKEIEQMRQWQSSWGY